MPEGISANFQIVDALPAGLRFLGNTTIAFVSATGTLLGTSDAAINGLAGLSMVGSSAMVENSSTPTKKPKAEAVTKLRSLASRRSKNGWVAVRVWETKIQAEMAPRIA